LDVVVWAGAIAGKPRSYRYAVTRMNITIPVGARLARENVSSPSENVSLYHIKRHPQYMTDFQAPNPGSG
jgi:hypothetical protein